ncbi:glycosyltransferase family 4 protein [Catenulispora sp. NF23]|uniref:Glycosyltransferase family 4 protein n=1 Tax=Catenulispora pinistramenti TaxID=2705254 RepID=A0ABS5KL85_9ACTN|nr:glycosyltransferase family 4 protein [Catenulispora pinistramenti]MBS2531533.1 glycosyltransferase family 4 protein [Catenulispora pinistramenti]MBS2546802.1 glycosyltransferase family 4 protein [Catenulispora pinistramenti]
MRILFATHTPLDASGSGIYLRKVAEHLLSEGHEALVLCLAGSAVDTFAFRQETIGTPGRPSRWNLPFDFPNFSGHRDSHLLYDDVDEAGIATYLDVWTSALTDLAQEFKPDVLVVNHAFLIACAAASIPTLPYVVVSHGSEFLRPRKSAAFDRYRRQGLQAAREVVAVAPAIAALMAEAGDIGLERIHIVSPGYDPDVFQPAPVDRAAVLEPFGLSAARPCVAYVGRIVAYKRVPDMLAGLAAIPAGRRPQALVVGDGPALSDAMDAAKRIGMPEAVFAGHIADRHRLADVFNAIDLLVLPSEFDPYPMTAIETLACGTPVLTSDQCGVTDIVADVAGAVYPGGDTQAIADRVQEALRDDWKASRGPEGPARVAAKAWPAIADQLLDILKQVA